MKLAKEKKENFKICSSKLAVAMMTGIICNFTKMDSLCIYKVKNLYKNLYFLYILFNRIF